MTLKSPAKFEEKLTCGLENEEFDKFSSEHFKVSNWYFHGIVLSKVENALATTYRG